MKNKEIVDKLNKIHLQLFSLEEFDKYLQSIKEEYVKESNQEQAKSLWIYQTIIKIHKLYINAFNLLKDRSYYQGWCQLERVEITIGGLKRHLSYDKKQYYLWHIEKSVKNLQVIFPYKLFLSAEILKKKKKCSVCDKEISIRNSCGHIAGEIYNGEMCHRIVTKVDILGVSFVENPGNKVAVIFAKDDKIDGRIDQYDYTVIDYLFELINAPYKIWDLEVSQREIAKGDYGRNDLCFCGSGKKIKKCCMERIGEKYLHYEFIFPI